MGLFNFIETFFFISLGITFVLILLLVYHFKQRMSTLEQKGDTMFEIINNMVQELTSVKRELVKQTFNEKSFFPQIPSFLLSTNSPEPSVPSVSNISYQKLEPVVEEENEESDDNSEGDSIEGDDTDDDYSFSDSEEEPDDEVKDEPEEDVLFDDVLSEQGDSPLVEPDEITDTEETVELVTVDLDEKQEQTDAQGTDAQGTDAQGTDAQGTDAQGIDAQGTDAQGTDAQGTDAQGTDAQGTDAQGTDAQGTDAQETEELNTEGKETEVEAEIVQTTEDITDTAPLEGTEDKEAYKKMTIHQLKTIVIAKGLSTDVGKLKKNELIRILESSHE